MTEVRQNPVDHPVPDAIRLRWSPVAYEPGTVDDATLHAVFEGARWAASSFNEQPWRFLVARRQDEERFGRMLECLIDANREWARHASAIALVCARTTFARNGKHNRHAWFDTGQATAQLMLSAIEQGLHSRPMGGFDADLARKNFNLSDDHDPICVIALGRLADGSILDDETAARDRSPRERKPLEEIVFLEGTIDD
jgi:nitroreductase